MRPTSKFTWNYRDTKTNQERIYRAYQYFRIWFLFRPNHKLPTIHSHRADMDRVVLELEDGPMSPEQQRHWANYRAMQDRREAEYQRRHNEVR